MPKSSKILPISVEEYKDVSEMILFYRDHIHMSYRVYLQKNLPENLVEYREWNSFYKLYKFLKERDIPTKLYIQAVLLEFLEQGLDKRMGIIRPFPSMMPKLFNLFVQHLQKASYNYGGNYCLMEIEDYFYKELGRDIIRLYQLCDFYKEDSLVILMSFPEEFGELIFLTNDEFENIFFNNKELKNLYKDTLGSKYYHIISRYKIYKEDLRFIQAKDTLLAVIDEKIENYKLYENDYTKVLRRVKLDLEEIGYRVNGKLSV
jgi:hypothetical protein